MVFRFFFSLEALLLLLLYVSVLSFMLLSYFYFELYPPLLSAPGEVSLVP